MDPLTHYITYSYTDDAHTQTRVHRGGRTCPSAAGFAGGAFLTTAQVKAGTTPLCPTCCTD